MNLIMVFGMCVCMCRSFLISLCMFTVSKALLMSRATVIVRVSVVILLNRMAIVLLMLCSAVLRGGFLKSCCMLFVMYRKRLYFIHEVPICMSLCVG